jgi:23S rRNA (guanosine2251-2'-O)-methyltransferase
MKRSKPKNVQKDHRRVSGRRSNPHTDLSARPTQLSENELLGLVEGLDHDPLLLVLDQVQDPNNLGACLRTADAAGVDAVVVPKDRSAPMSETVRSVASGAAETVPIARVTNLARTLRALKDLGVWIFGTSDRADMDLYHADLAGPIALVMGAEGKGLRRLTSETCDLLVRIPMAGRVDCLNVSVATGVCLFEIVRQRGVK